MTTADPLSLAQTQRLAANADTILLRATRPADLETPIGAFLRLDDGGPGVPARVGRGRRAARAVLVPRRRAAPAARGPRRPGPDPDPTGHRARLRPRPADRDVRGARPARRDPRVRAAPPRPADRGHAPLHRRRGRGAGLRRGLELRADRAAARSRPGRRAARRVHRDRPRARVRPPDPHPVGDRLAAHRDARPRGAATGSPRRRSSRRSSGRRAPSAAELTASAPRPASNGSAPAARRPGGPIETSLGRDEYIHAVEVAKDAIAAGEAIQVVLARRQSFDLPADPATGAPLDGIGLYRALRRVNPSPYLFFVRTPAFEVVGASRSCCSRSKATS